MILVVDYGMGNLRSVSKALESLGAAVKVSAVPSDIEKADKLVLPGVGAFGDAMRELERLIEAMQRHWLVRKYVNQTNPPSLHPLPEKKPAKVLQPPKSSAN